MLRPMLTIVVVFVAALVALLVLTRTIEPRFAFFPLQGETETPRDYGSAYESLTIQTRDGERLHGWTIPHPSPRARILYFHGNGGNLSVWAPILVGIARQRYWVTAFDYRGYGSSSGRPTEQGLYADVDAMVDRYSRQAPYSGPTIYWGRSLGTAMAAYAATRAAPDGVILESGFPDARTLVRTSPILALLALFSTYRFPVAELMARVSAPTLVVHGDADSIVPFNLGRLLFERLREPKRFVTIRGGDHNDAAPSDPTTYWNAIDEFIRATRNSKASAIGHHDHPVS